MTVWHECAFLSDFLHFFHRIFDRQSREVHRSFRKRPSPVPFAGSLALSQWFLERWERNATDGWSDDATIVGESETRSCNATNQPLSAATRMDLSLSRFRLCANARVCAIGLPCIVLNDPKKWRESEQRHITVSLSVISSSRVRFHPLNWRFLITKFRNTITRRYSSWHEHNQNPSNSAMVLIKKTVQYPYKPLSSNVCLREA